MDTSQTFRSATCALLLTTCHAVAASRAEHHGDFALIDTEGDFHRMSYYENFRAIALLEYRDGSGRMHEAQQGFKEASEKYGNDVKFFLLDASADETGATETQGVAVTESRIPILRDDTQLVSQTLGIKHIGEAVLLDGKSLAVIYRGPSGAPLSRALEQLISGATIAKSHVNVRGPRLVYKNEARGGATPSYGRDVAPLLIEHCVHCHRDGGVAPFAMNNYSIVKGFAPMIREVLLTKRMPPGQIDPHVGSFKNSYALAPDQIRTLIRWIDTGATKDGGADPLTQVRWPDSKWSLGEPDLIVKIPPQEIPATGVLPLVNAMIPIEGLDRDRYVRASEFIPGDRTVLHHAIVAALPAQSANVAPSSMALSEDGARISSYAPGAPALVEPPNTGGILRKGSSLLLNLHYTATGKATRDASEIGIWFYPPDQIPTERMSMQCACSFGYGWKTIPPYAPRHEMKYSVTLPNDALLISMGPHMHFRGKRMYFYAQYPNGQRESILNVANYDFNWQYTYELEKPKRLPKGTKITAIGIFDNSPQNKANPDPSRSVPFGEQSWDEMMLGAITLKYIGAAAAK